MGIAGDAGITRPDYRAGITDAFRDAEYLAEALAAGFTGPCPVDKALETYERVVIRRDADV